MTEVRKRTGKKEEKSIQSEKSTLKRSVLSYCQSIWDGGLFKFNDLPEWMKDNEYITDMHGP